jgi:hypothetical protein
VKVGEEHVKVNAEDLGAWSRVINKGKATMDSPHARLQARIIKIAAQQAKTRGRQKKKKKD